MGDGISDIKAAFVTLLSNSSTFQTLVGAVAPEGGGEGGGEDPPFDAAAEAAKHIYNTYLPPSDYEEYTLDELETLRPYALYWLAPVTDTLVSSDGFGRSGEIHVRIERDIPAALQGQPAQVQSTWDAIVGGICDDLCALGRSPGYALPVTGVTLPEDYDYRLVRDERSTIGDIQGAEFTVTWGGGAG